jgi:hypothetical protein
VPEGTQVRVAATGGIGNVSTPGTGGLTIGERTWQSDGFDSARDRYSVEVSTGVGEVRVRYY